MSDEMKTLVSGGSSFVLGLYAQRTKKFLKNYH